MSRLMKDLTVDRERNPVAAAADRWDPEDEDEEDGGDIDIIDRSTSSFYLRPTSCKSCLSPALILFFHGVTLHAVTDLCDISPST